VSDARDGLDRLRRIALLLEKENRLAEADGLYRLAAELETRGAGAFGETTRSATLGHIGRLLERQGVAGSAALLADQIDDPVLSGRIATAAMDYRKARRELDRARAADPFDPEAASARGALAFFERRFPEAMEDFLEAALLRGAHLAEPDLRYLRATRQLLRLDAARVRESVAAARERLLEALRSAAPELADAWPDTAGDLVKQLLVRSDRTGTEGQLDCARRLRDLRAFSGIDDVSLFHLAGSAALRRLTPGAPAFRAEDASSEMYLLLEGRVALVRDTPVGPQPLGECGPGDFVGAEEALTGVAHQAEATAQTQTVLLEFYPDAFSNGLGAPAGVRALRQSLARRLRALNDGFTQFFDRTLPPEPIHAPARPEQAMLDPEEKTRILASGGMSASDLALFAAFSVERKYSAEGIIFREGDPGDALYVIASGRVRISRRIPGAGEEALAILEPGSIFGELALIDPGASGRSADARAHQEATLLVLDRKLFETMESVDPEGCVDLSFLLCRIAARRILETAERLVRWKVLAGRF
jgi:CRP/FNR family transcriptional regulator, cyclic AMP receptor protein